MNKEASNNQPTRNDAVPIAVAEPQTCKLQQDEQENKNNNNRKIRNQWRCKKRA
jgi:hypothetical protein